ncbi:MAG: hypothetical protein P8N52_04215 [Crocinitomicaceae bacterium]|nr:hypothetical protein [Crocinitomicaceae bacterium]MDG1776282.1 hypothetical protein [Crocinitomicaceae bacterium]
MRNDIKSIITACFAVLFLTLSCGVTVSNVYCSIGSRWILGTEIPPCEKELDVKKSCCKFENNCGKTEQKNNESRSTQTYKFKFDFDSEKASTLGVDVVNKMFTLKTTPLLSRINSSLITSKEDCCLRFHPPPDLLNPNQIKLQTFRI